MKPTLAMTTSGTISSHTKSDIFNQEEREGIGLYEISSLSWPKLVEKSVIIHRDENGFGLRVKGQTPVLVEHVHENGAAWRAGVRKFDRISKVNGTPVTNIDHKDVVLMFKCCTRFVSLTLLSSLPEATAEAPKRAPQGWYPSLQRLTTYDSLAAPMQLNLSSSCQSAMVGCDSKAISGTEQRWLNAKRDLMSASTAYPQSKLILEKQNELKAYNSPDQGSPYQQEPKSLGANGSDSIPTVSLPTIPSLAGLDTGCQQVSLTFGGSCAGSCSSSGEPRKAHSGEPRRTSFGETKLKELDLAGQQQQQQRMRVECANCQLVSYDPSNDVCERCESRLELSIKFEPDRKNSKDHFSERHQWQRFYQSLMEPRRAQRFQVDQSVYKQANSSVTGTNPATSFHKLSQSVSTNSLPADTNNKNLKPDTILSRPLAVNKRLEIIKEFIDTEKAHTDRLRCLDELFYRPLKAGGYMSAEQLRMVFSCHRRLFKIHRQIYRILISANHSVNSEPMVGSALCEIFEGDLKRRLERASCTFCASQSTNAELLNKLTRRDTKVGEFLAQVTSQRMVGRLGIKDLLASCFQRLTKYPLLLENLLKATPQIAPIVNRTSEENNDACSPYGPYYSVASDFDETEELRGKRCILAISLAEEREFIQRALLQSRQILVKVNESVKVATSNSKLREIWKRTDKQPGLPLIDISKQQVVHEGLLTLRLSKRSFDVYVLLLNDYLIILTREGQDKYRLKFFTPEGKSSANQQGVYSPVFVIDEHLTTRDAATDENGFYLLCKRKDDSRIYEFASRSPAERVKWRDRIQWTVERQVNKADRRPSCKYMLISRWPR